MLFKGKVKDKSKLKDREAENNSPPESRKSKDTPSIAPTISTMESHEDLDRIASQASTGPPPSDNAAIKPTLMSRISRKASSNKFGSWKDKGGIFSRKENATPTGEGEEEQHGSTEQLGRSVESVGPATTTPSGEDKKASRTSLSSWNFMRRQSKRGQKEDLTASEVSESSERASEIGEETGEEDVESHN